MMRSLAVGLAVSASALHSPALEEVESFEEVANEDDASKDSAEDTEQIKYEEDVEDEEADVEAGDDDTGSLVEVAEDVDVDVDVDVDDDGDDLDDLVAGDDDDLDDDLDDVDDDDDDDDDALDIDLDDDLDSLIEEDGDDDDDEVDEDESDDVEDDEDDEGDEDEDEDDAEEKAPTMINEADDEQAESGGFEFGADMPLEHGPTDQASVFAKAKAAGKPAMVLASKSWCPHCKDLVESMNADPAMKALLSKFVAFHAPDSQGEAWHGDIGYVPRAFFYNKDGQQIDVHSPYAQYPYFFDSSKVLQDGMQTALSQA